MGLPRRPGGCHPSLRRSRSHCHRWRRAVLLDHRARTLRDAGYPQRAHRSWGALAKLRGDFVLDPTEARRPRVLQRAHLAANATGSSNVVEALQQRTPLRASRSAGRAALAVRGDAWRAGTDLPGRGPLPRAVRYAVYPLAGCAWLRALQKLALLWRRRPGRRAG